MDGVGVSEGDGVGVDVGLGVGNREGGGLTVPYPMGVYCSFAGLGLISPIPREVIIIPPTA